jgi:hypothetical protein
MALFGDVSGADFGSDYGDEDAAMDGDMGFGADMGAFGFGGGPNPVGNSPRIPRATPQAAMALWNKHHMQQAHTAHRESLIEPNKHSTVKIERYTFPLNNAITIGTAVAFTTLSGSPDVKLRPERCSMNAPVPFFATISEIKVANVSATIGGSNATDAYDFSAVSVGQALSLPTITPQNKVTVNGNYTGLIPPGLLGGFAATFIASFKGWAEMAG